MAKRAVGGDLLQGALENRELSVMPNRAPLVSCRNPSGGGHVTLTVELEQESDGRWIGEVPQLPGTLVYGASPEEATAQAKALAGRS